MSDESNEATMAELMAQRWDEDYDSRVERAICTTSEDGRAVELVDTVRGWRIRFGEVTFDRDALENGSETWWIPNDMAARMVAVFTSGWVPAPEPATPTTRTMQAAEFVMSQTETAEVAGVWLTIDEVTPISDPSGACFGVTIVGRDANDTPTKFQVVASAPVTVPLPSEPAAVQS